MALGNAILRERSAVTWKVFDLARPEVWVFDRGLDVLSVVADVAAGRPAGLRGLELILAD